MIKTSISYKVKGRKVNERQFIKGIEHNVQEMLADHVKKQIENLRDPETGERATVKIKGKSLKDMSFEVTGSEELIKKINEELNS